MIVRDEEDVLARSIACALAVADEVIVVDTGSADGSAAIARAAGAKVYDFEWRDDFSVARNYSFSLASGEYIMWLDADDVIECEDAEQIRRLVAEGGFDVAMLGYRSGDLYYFRERILRRSMNFVWKGVVHEVIEPRGRVVYSSAKIVHKKLKKGDPLRNLFIYQRHIAGGMRLDGRQQFYYGRELFYCSMYAQAIAVLDQFLRGDGWAVNKAEACRTLYYCHRALGDGDRAVSALTDAFLYLPPRAQDCCLLAAELFAQKKLRLRKVLVRARPAKPRAGGRGRVRSRRLFVLHSPHKPRRRVRRPRRFACRRAVQRARRRAQAGAPFVPCQRRIL